MMTSNMNHDDSRTVDFISSYFAYQNFNHADLKNANFSDSCLTCATFKNADLSHAHFSETKMSYTDLSGANLSHAEIRDTDLFSSNLSHANLSYAYFLYDTDLSSSNLSHANLSYAYFLYTNVSEANFSEANLHYVYLKGANLKGINFRDADLRCADLSDADLSQANLNGANLTGASLKNAILTDTQLLGSNLAHANLTGACIQGWITDAKTNLRSVTYEEPDSRRRNLSGNGKLMMGDRISNPITSHSLSATLTQQLQTSTRIVELSFQNSIDWDIFAYALRSYNIHLKTKKQGTLIFRGCHVLNSGILSITLEVPHQINLSKLHQVFSEEGLARLKHSQKFQRATKTSWNLPEAYNHLLSILPNLPS